MNRKEATKFVTEKVNVSTKAIFFSMKEFFGKINAQYMHSAINGQKVGMTSLLIFHFHCREVIVCKLGKKTENTQHSSKVVTYLPII